MSRAIQRTVGNTVYELARSDKQPPGGSCAVCIAGLDNELCEDLGCECLRKFRYWVVDEKATEKLRARQTQQAQQQANKE